MDTSSSSLVCDLARWLLAEAYAQACGFSHLTLDEAAQRIEDDWALYQSPSEENSKLGQSYLRCRAELLLLLTDYELRGLEEFPFESLFQLAELATPESRPSLFLDAADYFRSLRTKDAFGLNPLILDRLVIQHLCLAVEERAIQTLGPAIGEFWGRRTQAIQRLIDPTSAKLCLHSGLREGLEMLARAHDEWLADERLPVNAIFQSLRYIFSLPSQDRFHPSAFEMGVLVLLFGQSEELGGFQLMNELSLNDLTQSEVVELSFRLFRIQKIKAKVLLPQLDFDPRWNETAEEDANRVMELFESLERNLAAQRVA